MKLTTLTSLIITALLLSTVELTHGQKPIREMFPEREVVAEHHIDVIPQSFHNMINANDRFVSIIGRSYTDVDRRPHVYLFDISGPLVWDKWFTAVHRVELAEESDKVIVVYDDKIVEIDRYEWRNVCFAREGNKLWDIVVPGSGLRMSPDGKYGVTIGGVGEGSARYLQVYDLDTGTELETPIGRDYHHFRAQFVDSQRIVVLTQKIDFARDQEALKRLREMRRLGQLRRGVPWPNTWIKTYYPGLLIIYDIPSQTILTQQELFSSMGEPLYVPHDAEKHISVSSDKEHIATVLFKSLGSADQSRKLTLIQLDLEGNVEWDNSNLRSSDIQGLTEVDDGLILLNEPVRIFHLIDRSNGQTLWTYNPQERESSLIRSAFIEKSQLVLHTFDNLLNSRIHTLDLTTGSVIENMGILDEEILLINDPGTILVMKKAVKKLEFIKGEGK